MTLLSPFLSAQHVAIAVRRRHPVLGGAALAASVLIAALAAFLIGPFDSRAVQAPVMSLDMIPGDNTYDDTTNTMTVGHAHSSEPPHHAECRGPRRLAGAP